MVKRQIILICIALINFYITITGNHGISYHNKWVATCSIDGQWTQWFSALRKYYNRENISLTDIILCGMYFLYLEVSVALKG